MKPIAYHLQAGNRNTVVLENQEINENFYFFFQVRAHSRSASDSNFIEATKRDALNLMRKELDKLIETSETHRFEETQKQFDGFTKLFHRFLDETGPSVDWNKIEKLPEEAIKDYASLESPTLELTQQMLNKLVVVKLNGGLGTSMGCYGPKSVITVRNNLTFLDLSVQQLEVKQLIILIILSLLIIISIVEKLCRGT